MLDQWTLRRCLFFILSVDALVWGWTVTRYFEERVSTIDGYTLPTATQLDSITTRLVTVVPTVEHPTAIETITTSFSEEPAIGYDQIVLESGQAQPVSVDPETVVDYSYFVVFTYIKPYQCTYTYLPSTSIHTAALDLPSGVSDAVTPTSTTATTQVLHDSPTQTRTQIHIDAYLDQAPVPPGILVRVIKDPYANCDSDYDSDSDSHDEGEPDFSGCSKFSWYIFRDAPFGGGYRCPNGVFHTWGLQPWSLAVVVIFSWLGFFLLVGVAQSIVQFRGLMRGHGTRRGLPGAFCCLIPVVTAPLLYFHKKGFAPRSDEDKAVLTAQWDSMPLSEKIRLYLRYGFTAEYPPVLGPSPGPWGARPNPSRPRIRTFDSQEEYVPGPPPYTRNPTPPPHISDQSGDTSSGNVPTDQPPKYSEDESR